MTRPLSSLPGPRPLPLLGNLTALGGDPLAFMTCLAQEHGDVARFRVAHQTSLLVSDPALIEELLVKHRAATVKDPITAGLSDVLGNGLLTAEGETWKQNRRLVAPSFQPKHLTALGETMVACTEQHLDRVEQALDAGGSGQRDVHDDMMALTLDIAVRTLFGTELDGGAEQVGPLVEELMVSFNERMHTWRRLLPAWVPTRAQRMADHSKTELDRILLALVRQRRAEGGEGSDLLARLLAARDDDGRGMDDDQLRDEMITLFLAGHETTALSLSFAQLLLSTHPDIQAAVQAELDDVLGGRPPTAMHSRQLPLTDAVFQEAMRLYPPAWIIGRQATEDMLLDDIAVPAGTVLLMSPWVVHRDARWFDAPEEFRPDRWLQPSDRPRFSFFPFGGGPRVCVGNHFARMEGVLALASLLQRFELQAVQDFELTLMASVTLRPRAGVPVVLRSRPREQAAA